MSDTTSLPEVNRQRRGHDFYPPAEQEIPALYSTENVDTADKVVHLHYFGPSQDWWVTELDRAEGRGFGYCNLGDDDMAEWGYVSLPELEEVCLKGGLVIIERDCFWEPKTVRELVDSKRMHGRRVIL